MADPSGIIRRLPDYLVNRIAAGEVVERPAAALKELIENALDAGATEINIDLVDGGKALIAVRDNGNGMTRDDLQLAVLRHATSKLLDDDLVNLNHFGFRGEALPSIGAVARVTIATAQMGETHGWELSVEGGVITKPRPSAASKGTFVEVRDLFYATPARLKFLRGMRSELNACIEVIERAALGTPDVAWNMRHEQRTVIQWPAQGARGDAAAVLARVGQIMGKKFTESCIGFDATRETVRCAGLAGHAVMHRAAPDQQFFLVNGRPVKDRLLAAAVRVAYRDLLPSGRYPMIMLALSLPAEEVDVNVHPAKTELRFRDPQKIKGTIISVLQHALAETRLHSLAEPAERAVTSWSSNYAANAPRSQAINATVLGFDAPPDARAFDALIINPSYPLGAAKTQIFNTYIIAQTANDEMVLIDQHAAHERLVYERFKNAHAEGGIKSQNLLIPMMVETTLGATERLAAQKHLLGEYGFDIDVFGATSLVVRAVPLDLASDNIEELLHEIDSSLAESSGAETLREKINAKLADRACRLSVRAGRVLAGDEMNALLRQIEQTPNSDQCNHGRPTFVKLTRTQLEKLFKRS